MIKTIICDDNEKARYILKEYIKRTNINEIEIVGEASDGFDLINLSKQLNPDLILLDVDMPLLNGIEAAKKIMEYLPRVSFIFVTAYPSYSLRAFEVHAVDYILKPVSPERLEKAIHYVLDKARTLLPNTKPVNFSINYELYKLNQNDILFVEREDRKCLVHTLTKTLEVYDSLDSIGEKLDPEVFLRTHQSYLVNVLAVEKISKRMGGSHEVVFKGCNKRAYISKRNIIRFKNILKNIIV